MKKIYLIIVLAITTSAVSYAQESKQIRYVYTNSTQNSINELKELTKDNQDSYTIAYYKYQELEREGKIILSTNEYKPIKEKIENMPKNPMDEIDYEKIKFAKKAADRYVVVTELLKK